MNRKELKIICIDFRDYASRLLTTNDDYGIDDTKRLLNYIDNTKVIKNYIEKCSQCVENEINIEKIIDQIGYRDKYILPIVTGEEVVFTYSLLKYGVEKFESYYMFAYNGYGCGSNKIQDKIDCFNNEVVRHFINHIVKYLEGLSVTSDELYVDIEAEKQKTFISYCWADKDVVNMIDKDFEELYGITFTRDERDLKFKQSIKSFMNNLSAHDFVVMVISDSYIKSDNCMYEVMEVMRDRTYRDKIYCIILSENEEKYYGQKGLENLKKDDNSVACNIYTTKGRINYTKYWEAKQNELEKDITEIKGEVNKIYYLIDLKRVQNIIMNLGEFLTLISDMKNESLDELKESKYESFIKSMKVYK